MQKSTRKYKIIFWTLIAIAVLFAGLVFDRAMAIDAANLCSNDARAYEECYK